MTHSYHQRIQTAAAALATARAALGADLAAAIAGKTWVTDLRDSCDVKALVNHIDELARDAAFMASIRAAADRAREARGRGRGRPKKPERTATKPAPAKTPARATTETVAAE